MMGALLDLVTAGRVVQLARLVDGQPTKNPPAPGLTQRLYDSHRVGVEAMPGAFPGVTGASDVIAMATHSGTHMDSLAHIAVDGRLHDGTQIDDPGVQDPERGVQLATRENFSPIVSRGILLDFPALLGRDRVPQDYVMTADEVRRCLAHHGLDIRPGDTVLFRSGWDTLADDDERYTRMPIPGPDPDVARMLVSAGVVSTGADTMPFENAPGPVPLAVHVELIPRGGVFIFEMMDLRELASTGQREFLFLAAPLRIRGLTGSPVTPLAVVRGDSSPAAAV